MTVSNIQKRTCLGILIKKSSGKEGYVKICEGYAFSGFDEVYNRIKNRDSTISAENIVNEMLNETESERNHED